jgi:hypothetical protein
MDINLDQQLDKLKQSVLDKLTTISNGLQTITQQGTQIKTYYNETPSTQRRYIYGINPTVLRSNMDGSMETLDLSCDSDEYLTEYRVRRMEPTLGFSSTDIQKVYQPMGMCRKRKFTKPSFKMYRPNFFTTIIGNELNGKRIILMNPITKNCIAMNTGNLMSLRNDETTYSKMYLQPEIDSNCIYYINNLGVRSPNKHDSEFELFQFTPTQITTPTLTTSFALYLTFDRFGMCRILNTENSNEYGKTDLYQTDENVSGTMIDSLTIGQSTVESVYDKYKKSLIRKMGFMTDQVMDVYIIGDVGGKLERKHVIKMDDLTDGLYKNNDYKFIVLTEF